MSTEDALRRARDICNARIARGRAIHGVTDDGSLYPIPGSIEGTLLVYRTRNVDGVETCEPDHLGFLEGDPWMSEACQATLDRHVARHARRTLRMQAIGNMRGDTCDEGPLWSFTTHRLTRAALLEAGFDTSVLAEGRDEMQKNVIQALADASGVALQDYTVEDGRVDVHALSWRGLEIFGGGRPRIVIEHMIPETLAAALPGRPLSQVVSHPAVARAGPIRIIEVHPGPGLTTIILEDVQDHIRRPPPGTDRRWTRIPFMPTADIDTRHR